MLSVVITTFNRAECLEVNLKHFLTQTDTHFEVVVAIDGSTDSTLQKLIDFQRMGAFSLSWVDTKASNTYSLGKARNLGILNARGRGIVILDDDSFPAPNFVEYHRKMLRSKTLTGGYRNSHDPLDSLHEKMKKMQPLLTAGAFPIKEFPNRTGLWGPVENNCSMLKEDWIACGLFTEKIEGYGGVGQEFFERLKFLGFNYQFCKQAQIFHHREYEGLNGLTRETKNQMSLESQKILEKICSKKHFRSQIKKARALAKSLPMRMRHLKSGSAPTIFHAPGYTAFFESDKKNYYRYNPSWTFIMRKWKRQAFYSCSSSNQLTILTINTRSTKGLLEQSLDLLGVPYRVGGQGVEPFHNRMKLAIYKELLKTVTTPYVMGLDSYDVVVTGNPDHLVEKFKTMNCDMLFNCGKNFYPDCGVNPATGKEYITTEWREFEEQHAESDFKYLNAGCWISKTDFCKKFFTEADNRSAAPLILKGRLPEKNHLDYQNIIHGEQVIMHSMYHDFYPRVRLDYHCDCFLHLSAVCPLKDLALFENLFEMSWQDCLELTLRGFKVLFTTCLDISRPLRGRLRLRRYQWKT